MFECLPAACWNENRWKSCWRELKRSELQKIDSRDLEGDHIYQHISRVLLQEQFNSHIWTNQHDK
jgi:hypothetical protein